MKRILFKWDNLAATIFIFFGVVVIYLITINFHIFDPFHKAISDFQYTDFIYSKYKTHIQQDTNIVMVNIGNLDRQGIAKQIDIIQSYDPSVIALDIIFKEKKDALKDSLLRDVLSNTSNIVLASDLNIQDFEVEKVDQIIFSNSYFGEFKSGYFNLVGDSLSTKRYFRPFFKSKRKTYNSFASEIVKNYNTESYERLLNRNKEIETINYIGNYSSFIYFDAHDILNQSGNLDILKGKIVLMGYMGDNISKNLTTLYDAHITPMNKKVAGRTFPDSFGIVIHSNIVSTMLRQDYINTMPKWITWIIAFIICFFHVGIFLYFYVDNERWYNLISKVIQLVSSVVILYLVFQIYQLFNFKISTTLIIVPIILSADLLYFYDGFINIPIIYRLIGKSSYIAKHHENN